MKMKQIEVALTDLLGSPYQTRKINPDSASIKELAESLKEVGLMQPIVVRKSPTAQGKYEIIAGHRRWTAAGIAGHQTIQANLVDVDDRQAAEMCVTENLARKDLTPLEESRGVAQLVKNGVSMKDVATRLGRSVGWVRSRSMISELPESVHNKIENGKFKLWPIESLVELAKCQRVLEEESFAKVIKEYERDRPPASPKEIQTFVDLTCFMNLSDDTFHDMTECRSCMNRTGCYEDFFEEVKGLGRCMRKECYYNKRAEDNQWKFESFLRDIAEKIDAQSCPQNKVLFNKFDIDGRQQVKIPEWVMKKYNPLIVSWPKTVGFDSDTSNVGGHDIVPCYHISYDFDNETRKWAWGCKAVKLLRDNSNIVNGSAGGTSSQDAEADKEREARERHEKLETLSMRFVNREIEKRMKDLIDRYSDAKCAADLMNPDAYMPGFVRDLSLDNWAQRAALIIGILAISGVECRDQYFNDVGKQFLSDWANSGYYLRVDKTSHALNVLFFDVLNNLLVCELEEQYKKVNVLVKMHEDIMICLYGDEWKNELFMRGCSYLEAIEEVTADMGFHDVMKETEYSIVDEVERVIKRIDADEKARRKCDKKNGLIE